MTQGDIISPTIFNIVVDAVLYAWEKEINDNNTTSIFYADDGQLASYQPDNLQKVLI